MKNSFLRNIKNAKNEIDIQFEFESKLKDYFKDASIEHIHGCDGYLQIDIINEGDIRLLKLITEYKFEAKLKTIKGKAIVLIQVLYYLKKFQYIDGSIPNIILVADKECVFVIHTNDIIEYIEWDLDWYIQPSLAYKFNDSLLSDMMCNEKVKQIYVFDINQNFNFEDIVNKIKLLNFNVKKHILINENNISVIFDTFVNNVIKDPTSISSNNLIHIFLDIMTNPKEVQLHQHKKNTLILSDFSTVQVEHDRFKAFFSHYEMGCKPSDIHKLTEISDRLIEDTERRRKGEFYTPTMWVNEAHKFISEQLGEDWKNKYTVWDCAWGTGNLTRDYRFNDLYCSTLNKCDIETGKNYNREAVKFQYDFLNDDVELFEKLKVIKGYKKTLVIEDFQGSKLYEKAKNLISSIIDNKSIVFFINPPFGTSASMKINKGNIKEGLANTKLNNIMINNKVGGCSQQLYCQFLYRIFDFINLFEDLDIKVALFSPSLIYSGEQFKWFRSKTCKMYIDKGFMFSADEFADVKENWGITFTIWKQKININDKFNNQVYVKQSNNGYIVNYFKKELYYVDKKDKITEMMKVNIKNSDKEIVPTMSNGINFTNRISKKSKSCFGVLFMDTPRVEYNNQYVTLIPNKMKGNKISVEINEKNILDCMSAFAARRLITGKHATWINGKDEYIIPNKDHDKYDQWECDAIIYSLFNSSSNQSSLRNIKFNNKILNNKNEFFFMSQDEILELADEHKNYEVYYDIQDFGGDRYIYRLLKNCNLSSDAKLVLQKAINITKESFIFREVFNNEFLEYNINTWDAGWYQIKKLSKEYMPNRLSEFEEAYNMMGDRMRPLVYELGFLRV